MDKRIEKLSKTIVDYSIEIKEGDRVLIQYDDSKCNPLVKQLIKDICKIGAIPNVRLYDEELENLILEKSNDNLINEMVKSKQYDIDNYDCFIRICYNKNEYSGKNVTLERRKKLGDALKDINDVKINKRRWTLLNYPSQLDAYKAGMTTDEFYNYALDVMTVDYKSMYESIKPLKELYEKTDKVHIKGPGTDLTFSIKGLPAIPCCGTANIPDGELYTAPVKNSVNGIITYNTKSPYMGEVFNNVSLEFKDGKIVKATCDGDNGKLNEIFNTDEGARYVGEFSMGFNPMIQESIGDILYDEKIMGSLHFTPGTCYADCDNGNKSSVHWDLVLIQRKDHGGGEIYFDDVLIRKDGKFILDELKHLN